MTLGIRSPGLRVLAASVVCVSGMAGPAAGSCAGHNGYASAAELNVLGTPGT